MSLDYQLAINSDQRTDKSLGRNKGMPDGFALMKNDQGLYYFLKHDGERSDAIKDRFLVRRWAICNYEFDEFRKQA